MRITSVTTGVGDGGDTYLGDGRRVGKDALRVEACGAVDELSSQLGAAAAAGLAPEVAARVERIRNELFVLGADLAVPEGGPRGAGCPRIEDRHVKALEADIAAVLPGLGPLREFVLPGGSPGAAGLHVARAVCRRAERAVVALSRREPVSPEVLRYANRLSDWLFVLARLENRLRGIPEILWKREG